MSGIQMLDKKCYDINIKLVTNTVQACIQCSVSKLIYTSTFNVIYGGQNIVNGDENMPYYPIEDHTDCYSASKAMAEVLLLKSNLSRLSNGGLLTTCALRPAAIYGEGEQRHFPRIVKLIDQGLFSFRIGHAIVDWIHIDNLAHAYLATVSALLSHTTTEQAHPAIGGQAYFISDGSPIDNFLFLKPLFKARGVAYPTIVIPTYIMIYIAYIFEKLYQYVGITPFLTRTEVYKVGQSHYFSIDKAYKDLGFRPLFDSTVGAERMATYYNTSTNNKHKNNNNKNYFRFGHPLVFIGVNIGMGNLLLYGYYFSSIVYIEPLHTVLLGLDTFNTYIIPSRVIHVYIFWSAVCIHIIEAIYAYRLAVSMGCKNTCVWWCIQTVCIGYGSLGLLLGRQSAQERKRRE